MWFWFLNFLFLLFVELSLPLHLKVELFFLEYWRIHCSSFLPQSDDKLLRFFNKSVPRHAFIEHDAEHRNRCSVSCFYLRCRVYFFSHEQAVTFRIKDFKLIAEFIRCWLSLRIFVFILLHDPSSAFGLNFKNTIWMIDLKGRISSLFFQKFNTSNCQYFPYILHLLCLIFFYFSIWLLCLLCFPAFGLPTFWNNSFFFITIILGWFFVWKEIAVEMRTRLMNGQLGSSFLCLFLVLTSSATNWSAVKDARCLKSIATLACVQFFKVPSWCDLKFNPSQMCECSHYIRWRVDILEVRHSLAGFETSCLLNHYWSLLLVFGLSVNFGTLVNCAYVLIITTSRKEFFEQLDVRLRNTLVWIC